MLQIKRGRLLKALLFHGSRWLAGTLWGSGDTAVHATGSPSQAQLSPQRQKIDSHTGIHGETQNLKADMRKGRHGFQRVYNMLR